LPAPVGCGVRNLNQKSKKLNFSVFLPIGLIDCSKVLRETVAMIGSAGAEDETLLLRSG
jgi:hypothetical protein